jgi:PEGA domain-containing protein
MKQLLLARYPLAARRVVVHALVAILLALSFAPVSAMAGEHDPVHAGKGEAAALKEQGDHAMDALHYDDALAAYEKAYALTKAPALLYNQARAYQALGDYASALDFLERFETEAPPSLQSRVPDLKGLGADVRSKVSTLTLTCDAVGAEVVLRDKVIGTTPLSGPIRTTAGHATLVIHGDKYTDYRRELDLAGGQALTVVATLVPKDTSAVLVVLSEVAGAHVSVDGTLRGDVPVEVVTTPGLHSIRVERSGYETTETSAVVGPGTRKEVDVPLVKGTLVVGRWWFWTVVGAAVAGGVATYFAATTERSPDHGSINPGVLSTPSASSLRF